MGKVQKNVLRDRFVRPRPGAMSARSFIGKIVDARAAWCVRPPSGAPRASRSVLRTLISQRGEASGARSPGARSGSTRPRRGGEGAFFEAPRPRLLSGPRRGARRRHRLPSRSVAGQPRGARARDRASAPGSLPAHEHGAGRTAALLELRTALGRLRSRNPSWRSSTWTSRTSRLVVQPRIPQLERIDWNTPATVLEKLIAYEAVHEIRGFPDLKRRLERDRRCFAFFHPPSRTSRSSSWRWRS
jgi:malonyl-CoA decarboxylase